MKIIISVTSILLAMVILFFACQETPQVEQTATEANALTTDATDSPLVGYYEMKSGSAKDAPTFSIDITQFKDTLEGSYCAVANSKTDCGERGAELAFKVPVPKNKTAIDFDFMTYRDNSKGTAHIELSNKNIKWHIVTAPTGECYTPADAELLRETRPKE